MKKSMIAIVAWLIGMSGFAQDVKVEFFTPSIVHIVKGEPTKTLVVTAKPEAGHLVLAAVGSVPSMV